MKAARVNRNSARMIFADQTLLKVVQSRRGTLSASTLKRPELALHSTYHTGNCVKFSNRLSIAKVSSFIETAS
jgi:hypothetical protein